MHINKTCTARWGLVNTSHIQASWQNNVFWVQSPRLCVLLYLLFQIHSLIGREYAMCHGPKLTSSLGKQQLEVLSCIWSVWAPWKLGKFVLLAGVKQIFLTQLFFWRHTKHFRTCATGNSEFCLPKTLNVPLSFTLEKIEQLWGNKTHCFTTPFSCLFT